MTQDRQPPFHRSFAHALHGIFLLIRTQRNARIHLLATILVICAGVWFHLPAIEWALLIMSIGLVWVTEALNSAIEFLADAVSQDHHPLIGRAKDLAAAAVLLTSLTAVLIGAVIFFKHFV